MASEKSGLGDRLKAKGDDLRRRSPFVDHVVRMVEHYSTVNGSVLAGAVTYFGFLSFFPILAIAFSVIGYVAIAYPDAQDSLVTAIEEVFPGIVTVDGSNNTISIQQIADAKTAAGIIGFFGLLYTGLGWLSGMRSALHAAFELPKAAKRNFVLGKAIDVIVLGTLGMVMILSVGFSGAVEGLADSIIDWVGLDPTIGQILIGVVGLALGLAASTFLLFVMYRLLGNPDIPAKALLQGALLGALGFEVLKWLVVNILGGVSGSAFAPLAIAITLVIWINYFSRLVMFGASWAMTSPLSRTSVGQETIVRIDADDDRPRAVLPVSTRVAAHDAPDGLSGLPGRFDVGSAVMGAAAGAVAALLFWKRS